MASTPPASGDPFREPGGLGVARSFARRRDRYDDDDDNDLGLGRRPDRREENPTTAGMMGFIFCAVSAGLLIVVFILWLFLKQENQAQENLSRTRWMLYWFLFLDFVSFIAALAATVLGARSMAATNTLYRGYGVTALILGILEMIVTVIFGFFMTCAVLLFEALRNAGG
ncbi:MAG: hypothetical protein HYX68_25905 [Planctomycetes bacterium]|nr:hypothetical protein [Planctomycetota bacterium]